MIKCNELVPKIYPDSSLDFHIFTALLDLIFNSVDVKIESLKNLHSPKGCFEENLGRLSRFFNIDTSDRYLLSKYNLLSKSKGTEPVLKEIVKICGGSDIELANTKVIIKLTKSSNFNDSLFFTLVNRLAPFYSQIIIKLDK